MNIADILGYIDSLKRQHGGVLSDIAADPRKGLLGVGDRLNQGAREWNRDMMQNMGGLLSVRPEVQEQSMEGLLGTLPMPAGINAIRAFHGSPHKFDKFDLSKMGTGEGAQAYGWGGYVAENPNVAREYTPIDINVSPARALADDELDAWSKAYATMLDMKGDKTKAIESLRKQEKIWQRKQSTPMDADAAKWQIPRIRQAIGLVSDDVTKVTQGNANLYELDLRWPDAAREAADPMGPQHFLDWDKPLSQQPENVRKAVDPAALGMSVVKHPSAPFYTLSKNGEKGPFEGPMMKDHEAVLREWWKQSGGTFIHNYGDENAAKMLREKGVPGNRYLDAGSRGAGEGTANYVVFDDAIIELLKRNGIDIPKGK